MDSRSVCLKRWQLDIFYIEFDFWSNVLTFDTGFKLASFPRFTEIHSQSFSNLSSMSWLELNRTFIIDYSESFEYLLQFSFILG